MSTDERQPKDNERLNPDELGPAQPRDVDRPGGEPLSPDDSDGGKPHGTPDRPAKDQPVLPSTGIP